MRCFQLLTAIAVFTCSSLGWANNNLPPVPKKTSVVSNEIPTPATVNVKATAIIRSKGVQESPMPPACGKVQEAPMPPASGKVWEVALPPVPAKKGLKDCSTCKSRRYCRCCCPHYQPVQPIKFLANEFLCKPIYGIEKAINDAERRSLCCEKCRLKCQSKKLANEAQRLKMRIRNSEDCCLRSKFKLLQNEASYAAKANRNAILQAKLKCRQAEYCRQKARLKAKQARLYLSND